MYSNKVARNCIKVKYSSFPCPLLSISACYLYPVTFFRIKKGTMTVLDFLTNLELSSLRSQLGGLGELEVCIIV
jgi:hypothetical protein